MNDNRPIGILDSGIGGLTIARAVHQLMPHEQILFFGDTAHFPYGDKSQKAIRHYVEEITGFLLNNNCKAVLIACNTASAAAFSYLHEIHSGSHPILNVIDPLVDYVTMQPTIKNVGIIATKGTIKSRSYQRKIRQENPQLGVKAMATPLLAPMIEEGYFNNNISQTIINSYLENKSLQNIDALLLACTHYPLIKREISNYYARNSKNVEVVDSTDVVAQYTRGILLQKNLLASENNKPEHHFWVSDYTTSFQKTASMFFGEVIKLESCRIWE